MRLTPLKVVKPPATTTLPPDCTATAFTTAPAPVPGLNPVSSAPPEVSCATRFREVPPTKMKDPPTTTLPPEETATLVTPPPAMEGGAKPESNAPVELNLAT